MSLLNTTNPIALQAFMSETIFGMDMSKNEVKEEVLIEKEPDIIIDSLGANKKNILFIVDDLNNDFFSKDAELAFIKTLGALKLTIEDVAVINYKRIGGSITFDQIKKEFTPKACVFLGSSPTRFNMNFAENIITNDKDMQFLNSFSFEEMLTDAAKKRMFWDAIKLMNF